MSETDARSEGIIPGAIPGGSDTLTQAIGEALKLIDSAESIVVAAHYGPDGDAMGSTLGLTHFLVEQGKRAKAYNRDGVPYNFRHLVGGQEILTSEGEIEATTDLVVILDCSSLKRVNPKIDLDRARTKVLVIDHHATLDSFDPDVLVHDVAASAVGEILYRLIQASGHRLSEKVAQCLFVAIHTDTGSFRYSNTTPAALAAVGELVRAGVDVWRVASETYENHPVSRIQLLSKVLETLQISSCGRFAFLTVTFDMYKSTGTGPEMLDGFINFARSIQGVEVAAQMRQVDRGRFKVSLRSRGKVDVAELAARFGGGGHKNAAGCTIDGGTDQVFETLTAAFQAALDGA